MTEVPGIRDPLAERQSPDTERLNEVLEELNMMYLITDLSGLWLCTKPRTTHELREVLLQNGMISDDVPDFIGAGAIGSC